MINDDDDDDALPPSLRALLDAHTAGPPLSASAEARVLSRVLASVGVVTVLGATAATAATTTAATATTAATTTTTAASATVASVTSAVAFKVAMGIAAVVGVTGTALVVVNRPAPQGTSATAVATTTTTTPIPPSVPVLVTSPPAAVEVGAVPVEPAPVVAPVTRVKPVLVPPVVPVVVDEVGRLEVARAALSAGRAQEALAIIDALRAAQPAGTMLEERSALHVLALAAADRDDDAAAAAALFFARHPQSLFAERIRAALAR